MPKYKREVSQYIEDNVDILDVIGSVVSLKKAGRSYKGLCPFHGEKTPSFVVSPDKGFYHCFGCGESGGAISFIMKYENLGFIDAIESLADTYHIDLTPMLSQESANQHFVNSSDYYAVMTMAARYYFNQFSRSKVAVSYAKKRGLTPKIVKHFGIGYAPEGWTNLMDALSAQGVTQQMLSECGLIIKNDSGRFYDRFRNRLMFPIFDIRSRVVAFGGRVLDDSLPKYLNSPETHIFHKSNVLYGLNFVKKQISKQGVKRVILVEGYMDVVALHQYGYNYAVASLGTALTPEHVKQLDRVFDEVYFAFDADKAGRNAIMKSLPILENSDLTVKILDLSGAKDPDEILKNQGKEVFDNFIDQALNTLEFSIKHIEKEFDMTNADARIKFLHKAYAFIADYNVPSAQSMMLDYLAKRVNLKQQVVSTDYIAWQKKSNYGALQPQAEEVVVTNEENLDYVLNPQAKKIPQDTFYKIEKKLLKLAVKSSEAYQLIKQHIDALYQSDFDEIYQKLGDLYSKYEKISIDNTIDEFSLENVGIIDSIVRGADVTINERELLRMIYAHRQLIIEKQIEEIDILLEKYKLSSLGDGQIKYREALVKRMSLQKQRKEAINHQRLV